MISIAFIWSILAHMFPTSNNPQRVSNYKKYIKYLNIQGFDFSNGFRVCDVKKFEKLNNLSINIFELYFYQDICSIEIDPITVVRLIVFGNIN